MDPNSNQSPGLGLPPPLAAQAGEPSSLPQPDPAAQTVYAASPPAPTDDDDALDQDWVNKAKDIVERTKGDPFAESNELSKVKAGYLATRYNKQLNPKQEKS